MSQNSPLKGGREKDSFSFSLLSPAILVKGVAACWLACTSGLCLQTPLGGCGGSQFSILSSPPSEERDRAAGGPWGLGITVVAASGWGRWRPCRSLHTPWWGLGGGQCWRMWWWQLWQRAVFRGGLHEHSIKGTGDRWDQVNLGRCVNCI